METKLVDKLKAAIRKNKADESALLHYLKVLIAQSEQVDEGKIKPTNTIAQLHKQLIANYNDDSKDFNNAIQTGFHSIDDEFPFYRGELICLGARPGKGYSA